MEKAGKFQPDLDREAVHGRAVLTAKARRLYSHKRRRRFRSDGSEENSHPPEYGGAMSTGDRFVALSLESATTIAIGAFNPHIINPQWLVKNKVCKDAEVEFRFVTSPTIQTGIAFRLKDVQWQIDFQSLTVASQKQNCGELVAKVLMKLPHTPVRAVGNNFHYAGALDQWATSPLPMLGAKGWNDFSGAGAVEQLRWTGAFRRDTARIEITLAQSDMSMAVLFNFHRETKNSLDGRVAANGFDEDRDTSQVLLKQLFQQGVAK